MMDVEIDHAESGETTIADIVQRAEPGDRVHMQLSGLVRSDPWMSKTVTATGVSWFETDRFRVEVTDSSATGSDDVTLSKSYLGTYRDLPWTASLVGLERTPSSTLQDFEWSEWEVEVLEVDEHSERREAELVVEAPDYESAKEIGVRRAGLEHEGAVLHRGVGLWRVDGGSGDDESEWSCEERYVEGV